MPRVKSKEPIDYAAIPLRFTVHARYKTRRRWQYWNYAVSRWMFTDTTGAWTIIGEDDARQGRYQEIIAHLKAHAVDPNGMIGPSNAVAGAAAVAAEAAADGERVAASVLRCGGSEADARAAALRTVADRCGGQTAMTIHYEKGTDIEWDKDPSVYPLDWYLFSYCPRFCSDERGKCQFGWHKPLKYVYTIKRRLPHPTCPETLEVGLDCAAKLIPDIRRKIAAYKREKPKFEKSESWQSTVPGNLFL